MSMNITPNKRRDTLLRLPIGDFAEWHLMVLCAQCRQDRVVSIRSLLDRFGDGITLLRLIPRLRCGVGTCRQKPAMVRLRNRMPVHPGPPLIDVTLLDARPRSQSSLQSGPQPVHGAGKPCCDSPGMNRRRGLD